MFRKILVPYDDSEPAKRALANAIELAQCVDSPQVTVLSVVDWHDYNAETFKITTRMSGVIGDSLDSEAIAEIGEEAEHENIALISEKIADIVKDADFVDITIVNGSPHETIVAYASDLDYDVIVMGHRGMGVIRGMLGSVAFSVLQKANKPVLVVK